jgi:hypothetical protein
MQSILLALTLTGCGPKKAPATAATAEPAPVEAAPAPAPEPVEPPPPPPEVKNADFTVSFSKADGTKASGHVKRIERGVDTYGEEWTSEEKELLFYVEGGNEYKKISWNDVKSITISPIYKSSEDFDCLYTSDYSPWMYECAVKLKSRVTTKDGKTYAADSGHKWLFTFDDNTSQEFWLKKHYARQQDEAVVDLNVDNPENYKLYGILQQQLRTEMKTVLVKGLQVQ